ncbi:MAG: hypothetical protein H0U71_07705 [Gammaproteobacteria bacterium]|nr:hypothetical protein [Gammaproteobacteria bacterium]
MKSYFIFACGLLLPALAYGHIYEYKNQHGGTVYSNHPPLISTKTTAHTAHKYTQVNTFVTKQIPALLLTQKNDQQQ